MVADVQISADALPAGVPLSSGRVFRIVVERSRAALQVRFLTNAIPPWRDSPSPQARLLDSAGKTVAAAPIESVEGTWTARFAEVPAATPLQLAVDGASEDGEILQRAPLDAPPSLPPQPAPGPEPSADAQGRVFVYHDALHDRRECATKEELRAHARRLGGFYLLDGVGRGQPNRPAFDDVRRVQERLWALGLLAPEAVGQPLQDSDADPTVAAIRQLQERMEAKKPDGAISPDGTTHHWLMGLHKLEPAHIFTPEEPLESEQLLEPGQNPAWTDAGRHPRNVDDEEVVLVVKDTPLWHMIRAFDPDAISRRHYDIVDPLDGLTFGIAHWPLNDGHDFCRAVFAEEETREAFLMRFREFFEVDENEVLWQIFQRDAARGAMDLEVGELDLRASLPTDVDIAEALEDGLRKTLLVEGWWRQSKTSSRHAGRRCWDLLWFRKAFGYALRDRRIVELQLRFWVDDVIARAQKACLQLGIRTVGGMAAMVSLLNSRKAWLGGLPKSGKSYAHRRWQKKYGVAIDYDADSGALAVYEGDRRVEFDWKRTPTSDWRSYVVWQFYWTMRDLWDRKPDLRGRMQEVWNRWYADAFGRRFAGGFKSDASHHALTSLPPSAHRQAMEAGTLLPEDFDRDDRSTWATMRGFIPCYARLAAS